MSHPVLPEGFIRESADFPRHTRPVMAVRMALRGPERYEQLQARFDPEHAGYSWRHLDGQAINATGANVLGWRELDEGDA